MIIRKNMPCFYIFFRTFLRQALEIFRKQNTVIYRVFNLFIYHNFSFVGIAEE